MKLTRRQYAEMFGPTVGDQVRLADTELFIEVERDLIAENGGYGNEVKFGGGKVIRDGMGQSPLALDAESLDLVITNASILDAVQGVIKADIGMKRRAHRRHRPRGQSLHSGRIGMIIGAATEVIAGEGCIVTAGGIDTHIHFICPQQIEHALASGVTTMIGGGTGPAHGTYATTCTPGHLEHSSHARGRRRVSDESRLSRQRQLLDAGAAARAGAARARSVSSCTRTGAPRPPRSTRCLGVADELDVQVAIHTDTLNEAGFVEDTIAAFKGRTIHTFHSEGAGGGHAPDIIRVCGEANVLPSSTNPTRPFTVNTIDEHLDMLMVCHHLDSKIPEDVAFAESRIRPETIAAEDLLHDLGAFSMMSSDTQAMGRVGEVITRTWQTAHKMKVAVRRLLDGPTGARHAAADNFRALRYIAKYTINPAITHGISHEVGRIEVGKLADLVVWKPAFFGVKPEVILKGGFIAWPTWAIRTRRFPRRSRRFTDRSSPRTAARDSRLQLTFVSGRRWSMASLDHLHLCKRLGAG